MEDPRLAWRPSVLSLATLAAVLAVGLVVAGSGAADEARAPPCPDDLPADLCTPGAAALDPEPAPAPDPRSPDADPGPSVDELLRWAEDTAAWAQAYPNTTYQAAEYMLQSEDDRDQGDYPAFHAAATQRGADLALRPAGEEARYPEGTPAYGGENVVNGSKGRNHRQVLVWNPTYGVLDGHSQPVPVTTATESAVVDDCDPHRPIEIVGDVGVQGFAVAREPVTGQPVYRPGSGVVGGSGTADDPYVIEGWCINRATGDGNPEAAIRVAETEAHVVVRGNQIDDHEHGIRIEDAANVTVADNEIRQGAFGVTGSGVEQLEIRGNLVDVATSGIGFGGSNVTIVGNVIRPTNWHGIGVGGDDNRIEANVIQGTDRNGIRISAYLDTYRRNVIRGNLILDAGHGIELRRTAGTVVEANDIRSADEAGLLLQGTSGMVFEENRIKDTASGEPAMYLLRSDDGLLRNNTIVDNGGPGIDGISRSEGNRIVGNTLEGNDGSAVDLGYRSSHHLVENNTVAGNWDGITGGGSDHVIRSNDLRETGAAVRVGGSALEVRNNSVEGGTSGIRVRGSGHVVANNTVVDTQFSGLGLRDGDGVEAHDNALRRTDNGITLWGLQDSNVTGNTVVDAEDGLFVYDAHRNRIDGNSFEGSEDWGATFWSGSHGNDVTNNTIVDGAWDGVDVRQGSHNNTFRSNVVRDNSGDGLQVRDSANTTVADNVVDDHPGNGIDVSSGDGALVLGNEVAGNADAVAVENSRNVTVRGNNLSANAGAGLRASSLADPVDARENWWGADTGPAGGVEDACTGTVADGDGAPVRTDDGAVCFDPWLTSPP